jgi:site-specific DNA-cytosine methylase
MACDHQLIVANSAIKIDMDSKHELSCDLNKTNQYVKPEIFNISQIQTMDNSNDKWYSVAEFATGGCLDAIAAINVGFRHVWGTEIDKAQALMWEHLTKSKCLGDTFKIRTAELRGSGLKYLKTGMPCPDYSSWGNHTGSKGKTGWMFTEQVPLILEIEPLVVRIEMSDNAVNINKGSEVNKVIELLTKKYTVYSKIIAVKDHGDPTSRKRLFIVGVHHKLGQLAHTFEWPNDLVNNNIDLRALATPDRIVPTNYWRKDKINRIMKPNTSSRGLRLIGMAKTETDHCDKPKRVYSWDGLANTQTTFNGGGRRPKLDHKEGEPILLTRMTTPLETVRMASLPDDYLDFCYTYAVEDSDTFLRKCVNNGVPIKTSMAIDRCVMDLLNTYYIKSNHKLATAFSIDAQTGCMRSALFDTGANSTLLFRDLDCLLAHSKESELSIQVANKERIPGGRCGTLNVQVINTTRQPNIPYQQNMEWKVTTAAVGTELMSFDNFYQNDWGLHIQPNSLGGEAYIFSIGKGSENKPDIRIPLRYNWGPGYGFYLDYMVMNDDEITDMQHSDWLKAYHADMKDTVSNRQNWLNMQWFNKSEARAMATDKLKNMATKIRSDCYEVIFGQEPDDVAMRGVKVGLRKGKNKLSIAELHKLFGHLGYQPDCMICKLVKGAARRIYRIVDPHKETRAAYAFYMDTITWSDRSEQGNKYTTVLRCAASGTYKLLHHYHRNDIVGLVHSWVKKLRLDPAFDKCNYKVLSILFLDNAGEWDIRSEKWNTMVKEHGIECVYTCPDRCDKKGLSERACGILEPVVKALLMQHNLPPTWWEYAANNAEFLLNRLPLTSDSASTPLDGDSPRPYEIFTKKFYSRRQIDRELSYFIPVGTPALIQTDADGAHLQPKTRWGIAINMYREQVTFMCPYTLATFRSKSFAAFELKDGMNFRQFLNMKPMVSSRRSAQIPTDFDETITVDLKMVRDRYENADKPHYQPAIKKIKISGDMRNTQLEVHTEKASEELRGSIQVHAPDGKQLNNEPKNGSMEPMYQFNGDKIKQDTLPQSGYDQGETPYIDVRPNENLQRLWDEADAEKESHRTYITKEHDNLPRIVKSEHQIDFPYQHLYKQWLIKMGYFTAEHLPNERGDTLASGMALRYPTGSVWNKMCQAAGRNQRRANYSNTDPNIQALNSTMDWLHGEISNQRVNVRERKMKYKFNKIKGQTSIHNNNRVRTVAANTITYVRAQRAKANKIKKRKRAGAVGTGKDPPPKNARDAIFDRPDSVEWAQSMTNEFYGLVQLGVLDLGYTEQQLKDEGIYSKPVPLGTYFDNKYDQEGVLAKRKTRIAVKGHPGNMTKGIHYEETFSATPRESTAKILCALAVLFNLQRKCFDITKAYCWADLPPDKLIAVEYPPGFVETHPATGEKLYIVMRKNLYGHPAAGRIFGKARDKAVMEHFNKNGWSCKRTRMDPCLFVIKRSYTNINGKLKPNNTFNDQCIIRRAWMAAHVDDCDIVGEGELILDALITECKEIWNIEVVNPEFMLGIKRTPKYDNDGTLNQIECTMTPFIDGMYDTFKDWIKTERTVTATLPTNFSCSKSDPVEEDEAKQVLKEGYQCLVGMLLWAARHCYPECRVGVSILCRVMARPSWSAFKAGTHMVKWMYQRRDTGVIFSRNGNKSPMCLVDASAKPDKADMKAQYGYVCMWMGGPIIVNSKKLKHIGMSSEHCEYMAMCQANMSVVWMRQLLFEMGLSEFIEKPTLIWADNRPANILSQEDVITTGNQYIYLQYHYNKEVQELGFSKVMFIPTKWNISDLLTKVVGSSELNTLMWALLGYYIELINKLEICAIENTTLDKSTIL